MKIHLGVKKRNLALRMKLWLSYQAGKKIESREEKGSVKIWELDSDNSNFTVTLLLSLIPMNRQTH